MAHPPLGSSKHELKFERFQQAQQVLFQAEEMSSKRREAERKANEEFDRIQQELSRLTDEKLNVVCIIAMTFTEVP